MIGSAEIHSVPCFYLANRGELREAVAAWRAEPHREPRPEIIEIIEIVEMP